ncbi:PREDICTED: schlafen family member 11-like [Chrysochloris asiatica]|uniref:Schlafen family member 11-like n=1 Tax=Chrysochloris asiatica TaxID=185453 RepID=A0A9B0SYZ1_CHRAS|nr:PREDICTED: schlafen family member 11-like [Chrysochloris asiatica]
MEKHSSSLVVELSYPDLVINVGKVTLGEENRRKLQKPRKDQEKERVMRAACALLNSGGGVIQMEMANKDEHPIEPSLRSSNKVDVVPFLLNLGAITLPLKMVPSRLAFAACALHCTGFNNADPAFEFFQRDNLEYGEILPFPESPSIEFKQFSTKHFQTYLENIIPVYVSAFANTEEGGYLFIGVEDKSRKVLGCAKENVNPYSLRARIEKAILKLPCVHFCQSACQINFTTKILNVFAKGKLYGFACVIRVKPFCCAVFSEEPSSWLVENQQIHKLTIDKWVDRMMDIDQDLSRLCKDFESQLSLTSGPPLSRPVFSKKGLEHKKDLQQLLFPVPSEHLQCTPEPLWKELSSQHEGLEKLIKEEMPPLSRGILIFSRSWAVDLDLQEKQGVICDALLIAQGSPPILYTVLREKDAAGQHYSMHTAFTLKQKLVNMGGYTRKLCVLAKVLSLSAEDTAESSEGPGCLLKYSESYSLADTPQMEALLQSLVIVLLGFRSFLSDKVGCEVLNLLTAQQYKIFSKNLHKNRELFIHGLPGSGKTIIAMKIMEKISKVFGCPTKEILYICENQPLRNFLSSKNVCQAVTRKTFMNSSNFESIQHIIIDEAQNFRTEDGDWYEKAKKITHRKKDCPGILWIFMDYFQTSHLDCSGLPPLSAQFPKEELTKVVRNADLIANYLMKAMKEVREKPPPNIPHESLKMLHEAEWTHSVRGTLQVKKDLTLRQMMTYVADTCKSLFEMGYSPNDVAVLVSTTKEVDRYKHELLKAMRKKRVVQLCDACDMSGNHMVLDSVRRFSGLERSIVFGIHPKSAESAILDNILVCLASRAKQQLYILWHGDY